MCIVCITSVAQEVPFAVINVESNDPSAVTMTIKTFAKKKNGAKSEAIKSALKVLLFEGLASTPYDKPLLPLSAKREQSEYISDLLLKRTGDFIKSIRQTSDFHKAVSGEKSTFFEICIDYNQLKSDVKKQLTGQGQTVADIQSAFNQKKPTLMILPSDNWCSLRLYTTTIDNQGTKVKVPNYVQAFQDDPELSIVISKVGGVLTGLGYSLKDAEQVLKAINDRQAEDNITTSKNMVSPIAENPLDNLKKRAKADIIIQLWWKVNKEGDNKSVSLTMEAFDAYTSKRIGTSFATGMPSSEIIPVLLERAVHDIVADFDNQMVTFYNDINNNGREIVLSVKKWDSWDEDLESEFAGNVLLDIIEDWLHENTVKDSFNLTDSSENIALFEQVRIPLTNRTGRAIDARTFVTGLQKYLKNTYGIPSKLMVRGLGETNLILGEQ